jgi:hypothetical protein
MKKKLIIGVFALAMIAILGFGAVSAYGFGRMSSEEKESMKTAIQDGDFETWKTLKQERMSRMFSEIDEEKFNELRARHQERAEFRNAMMEARDSGDWERVQELKAQYGTGKGMHKRNMNSGACPFA